MPSSKTCCGAPYIYVDTAGYYINPMTGLPELIINNSYSSPTFAQIAGKCALFLNKGYGSDPQDPNDCPCCPDNYTYIQSANLCQGATASDTIPPSDVYCLPCICVEPVDPPPCEGCQENSGNHISFVWTDKTKTCTDCVPDDSPVIPNNAKLNCFAPYFILVPVINFTLD